MVNAILQTSSDITDFFQLVLLISSPLVAPMTHKVSRRRFFSLPTILTFLRILHADIFPVFEQLVFNGWLLYCNKGKELHYMTQKLQKSTNNSTTNVHLCGKISGKKYFKTRKNYLMYPLMASFNLKRNDS